jgi:BirA family transcriptional regulator, biotin operon repressor / biotin---[acetyl-CoA-carboxylase] ligase
LKPRLFFIFFTIVNQQNLVIVDICFLFSYHSIKICIVVIVVKRNSSAEFILTHLKANGGSYISGQELSARLGISRAAVSKQVGKLRLAGYQISSATNRGYSLVGEPDRLNSKLLEAQNIIYLAITESTNKEAKQLAEKGLTGYSCIAAEEQSKGRGRLGRDWFSPAGGGLWFSILLKPDTVTPAEAAPITLVTAAVIAEYFNQNLKLPVKVKWPNDLLVNEKKLGGILTELKGEPDHIDYLVIGIGLNIAQNREDFPPVLRDKVTSLFIESGALKNRTSILLQLRDLLFKAYQLFFQEGFKPFRVQWKKYSSILGHEVTVRLSGQTISGKAEDITEQGALILTDNSGAKKIINYGEII